MKPLHIEMLCNNLGLGEIIVAPIALSGGFLHRMYSLQATLGRYVVKALNPEIMSRPTAMQNFINSERIAIHAANYVPALPAKKFNGTSIQQVDDQFCLVFDWIDGKSLRPRDITTSHCEKIGGILSSLHKGNFSDLGIVNNSSVDRQPTDWSYYLKKGQETNAEWANLLFENIEMLKDWNAIAIISANELASELVISHGDLDPKNVMWDNIYPTLIDWECAGFRNPKADLIETAIYWSENEPGAIDRDKFLAFIAGYKRTQEQIQANWRMILASGFLGKLDWLEYSLKRSLWFDCTEREEQEAGTAQVAGTLASIRRYAETITDIEGWLRVI